MTRLDPAHDTIQTWLLTGGQPPLTGGPTVAPVTAGKPRGTTQVVTRGILMIEVRGTIHRIAGTRFLEGCVACSHWWIQLA
ncbi:hypothetical protein Tco_1221853 [Tanacetum coccineum]